MAWVRIDDGFYDHPRWATAPGDSIALWLAAMAWCNRNDAVTGHIPALKLNGLVNVRNVKASATDLVTRGAFVAVADGYFITSYEEYQQNEKVQAIRAKRRDAGKAGADARWGSKANDMASAMANAMAKECPGPGPVPESSKKTDDYGPVVLSSVDIYVRHTVDTAKNIRKTRANYERGVRKAAMQERAPEAAAHLEANPKDDAEDIAYKLWGIGQAKPPFYTDPNCVLCEGDGWATRITPDERTEYGPCPCRQDEPYPEPLADVINLDRKATA